MALWMLVAGSAWAGGFSDDQITLHSSTVMYIDAAEGDTITVFGTGGVILKNLSGGYGTGWLANYEYEFPLTDTWSVEVTEDQAGWSVSAKRADGGDHPGVYSYAWELSTTGAATFSESLYVPVPVDSTAASVSAGTGALAEMSVAGLRGEGIRLEATDLGLSDAYAQSVGFSESDGPEADRRLRMYLSHPGALSAPAPSDPHKGWSVSYDDPCEVVFRGEDSGAELSMSSGLTGLGGVACDQGGDGTVDLSGRHGETGDGLRPMPGNAVWRWDGSEGLPEGVYTCMGGVLLGTAHAIVSEADVADPGVRWFDASGESMHLFWDDSRVDQGVLLSSGDDAATYSGPSIESGASSTAGEANENSHGWGNPSAGDSRGSSAWIDTWTKTDIVIHGEAWVPFLDRDGDYDGDGITSGDECALDTDPTNPDSDGGGVSDGTELEQGTDPTDPTDDITEDTGATDTGAADTAALTAAGSLSGGACRCSTRSGPARPLFLAGLIVIVGIRRRTTRSG